jgi:2-Cys peroxiredoxin 5
VLTYNYAPDYLEKRVALRPEHFKYAHEFKARGQIIQGGAILEPKPTGLISFYATREEVEKFAQEDPYVKRGLATSYEIREWNVVVGSESDANYFRSAPLKEGDRFPAGQTLYEGTPTGKVDVDGLLKSKRVLFFGVPGAFTPGCSKTHLPGYVEGADALKARGKLSDIVCVSVNDPFVMAEWGKAQKADGKVRMLADPRAETTRRLGLAVNLTAGLGSWRSKRYSMLVDDGVISQLNVEPESAPTGLTCSLASALRL